MTPVPPAPFIRARIADHENAAPANETRPRLDHLLVIVATHRPMPDPSGLWDQICHAGCDPTAGYPCTTLTALARIWASHPDYRPEWGA